MDNPFEIPDDVLRNMANLNKENNPNWLAIKKWISLQLIHYQNSASMGVHLSESQVRQYQGACVFLYNLSTWTENPEEELRLREATKVRVMAAEPIKVS